MPQECSRWTAYIGIGGNLPWLQAAGVGERAGSRPERAVAPEQTLRMAVHALRETGAVVAGSGLWRTEPVGPVRDQPAFVNGVVVLETGLAPEELLRALLALEARFGRLRGVNGGNAGAEAKGPRTLDLDLLLMECAGVPVVQADAVLTLPHPEMHRRRFVLAPLHEVAPMLRHPLRESSVRSLLQALPEGEGVERLPVETLMAEAGSSENMQDGITPWKNRPVGNVPAGIAPVGNVPTGTAPVENVPTGSETVENAPVGSETVENAPVENAPDGNETLGNETVENAPAGSETVENAPADRQRVEALPVGRMAIEVSVGEDLTAGLLSAGPRTHGVVQQLFGGTENCRTPGRLEVITGPMFSGKSEELIRRLRRAEIARLGTVCLKPQVDTRGAPNTIASHNRQARTAIGVRDVAEMREALRLQTAEVVGLDEVQFFSSELPALVEDLLREGRRVIAAGLDMTFAGRPFGPVPALMAVADEVLKLSAVCMVCGAPAVHSQRLGGSRDTVLVGATEAYEARCRMHFHPDGDAAAPALGDDREANRQG